MACTAKFGEELSDRKKHLEAEVANALEDGVVTVSERAALDRLAEELNITQDSLERLLNSQALTRYTATTYKRGR